MPASSGIGGKALIVFWTPTAIMLLAPGRFADGSVRFFMSLLTNGVFGSRVLSSGAASQMPIIQPSRFANDLSIFFYQGGDPVQMIFVH